MDNKTLWLGYGLKDKNGREIKKGDRVNLYTGNKLFKKVQIIEKKWNDPESCEKIKRLSIGDSIWLTPTTCGQFNKTHGIEWSIEIA